MARFIEVASVIPLVAFKLGSCPDPQKFNITSHLVNTSLRQAFIPLTLAADFLKVTFKGGRYEV